MGEIIKKYLGFFQDFSGFFGIFWGFIDELPPTGPRSEPCDPPGRATEDHGRRSVTELAARVTLAAPGTNAGDLGRASR